ncbi:MAG TPA: DUF2148 domain-containing protein [Methanocella sp.]|uniref:ferredoxin domain-containing protein n=1 Tax=Methanocella sp. TaxID=2052833 RepID=UPI002C1CF668|nr:DUF2148 domain-containing protein [Methanocella sp.]HTY91475.1 DUF2148 domain-containing protein [Methanocella sp.]
MITKGKDMEQKAVEEVAALMCAAARTAPKGKGVDNLLTMVVTGRDKDKIAKEMRRVAEENSAAFFARDAGCVDSSQAVVLLGQRPVPIYLPVCGYCGFKDCAENIKHKGVCAISTGDLGIAACSAAAVAGLHHIDNRIMFSVGRAALNLKLFKDSDIKEAYGIPLSVTGKSPFFDRK